MQNITHRSSVGNENQPSYSNEGDNKKENKTKEEIISFVSCDFEYNMRVFMGLLPGLIILLAFCGKLYII